MKTANILLVIVVAATLVAGFLLATRFNPSFVNNLLPPKTTPAPIKEMYETQLSLEPSTTSLQVGQESYYNLTVEPNGKLVVGVDSELFFDPTAVTVTRVEPTEFLNNPDILTNRIDATTGKVSYSLGTRQPVSGKGTLFRIYFTPLESTSGVSSLLSFDKENTTVALQNTDTKVIGKSQTVVLFNEQPVTVLP